MPKMKYYDETTSQWVTLDAKNAEAITDGVNTITPQQVVDLQTGLNNHTSNADIHFTSTERAKLSGIAANANNYTLPNATTTALGGVKVGTNISVSTGTISVANASTTTKGVVQLNNTTTSTSTTEALAANQGKVLNDKIDVLTGNLGATNSKIDAHVSEIATTEKLGHIKPDGVTTEVDPVTGEMKVIGGGVNNVYFVGDFDSLKEEGNYYSILTECTNIPPNQSYKYPTNEVYLVEVTVYGESILQRVYNTSLQFIRFYDKTIDRWSLWRVNGSLLSPGGNALQQIVYVNNTTGIDHPSMGGSADTPLKTIKYAIENLGYLVVTTYISNAVAYISDMLVISVQGQGDLSLNLTGMTINTMTISGCTSKVSISGSNITLPGSHSLNIINSSSVLITGIVCTDQSNLFKISVRDCASVSITNSMLSNGNKGIYVSNSSNVVLSPSVSGSGNITGIENSGSTIRKNGATITGTTPQVISNGGQIVT